MAAQIIWTPEAAHSYEAIIRFLMETWGVSVAIDFVEMVRTVEDRLSHTPEMGSRTDADRFIRSFVLHKNVRLYYRYDAASDTVELAIFFDLRQDPSKLTF